MFSAGNKKTVIYLIIAEFKSINFIIRTSISTFNGEIATWVAINLFLDLTTSQVVICTIAHTHSSWRSLNKVLAGTPDQGGYVTCVLYAHIYKHAHFLFFWFLWKFWAKRSFWSQFLEKTPVWSNNILASCETRFSFFNDF